MVQVIDRGPSFGENIANSLGQALEGFAQQKLQRTQQRHYATGLQALGIPAESASQIAMLPPELQNTVIKSYLSASENQGLEQSLSQLLGGSQESPSQQLNDYSEMRLPSTTVHPFHSKIPEGHPAFNKQLPQQNESMQPKQSSGKSLAEILKNPRLKPEHRLQIAKLQQQKELAEQNLSASEQRESNKETKPVYEKIKKEYKASKDSEKRLGRMKELIKKGNLPNAAWGSALKTLSDGIFGFGIDLKFLTHPDSQEFNKLSKDFVKNAKDYFGSRLTDNDLNVFLQTIPDLSLTDEGKIRVINNLESFDKAADLRYNAMKEIIKENSGKRPSDLEERIEDRISSELDELAKKFKEGSASEEEEGILTKALRSTLQI